MHGGTRDGDAAAGGRQRRDRPNDPRRLSFQRLRCASDGLLTVALFEALKSRPNVEVHLFALNRDEWQPDPSSLQAVAALHDVAAKPHALVASRIREARNRRVFDCEVGAAAARRKFWQCVRPRSR
jgi:hypothetical protein